MRTASRASTSAERAAFGRGDGLLTIGGRGIDQRRLLGVVQPLLERGELLDGLLAARLQLVALADQPLPFVVGGAGVLAEPAELLVDRRDRGVRFVERGQCLLGGVLAGLLFGQRTGQCRAELTGLVLGLRRARCGPSPPRR